MTDLAPPTLGHYRLEDRIDRGGMGEVFRAWDTRLDRPVAIKIMKRGIRDADPTATRRFMREARAASALNHPNIVVIHEIAETDTGDQYLVQEFIEGRTLRVLMEEELGPAEVANIGSQIARALGAAHGAGITHRDVKPDNVMRRADGWVKVLDFGLARLTDRADVADPSFYETELGTVLGTPAYMSPEQAGGGEVTPASDVFSLGVVLYEVLAGRQPFTAPGTLGVIAAILTAHPAPLQTLRPDVPAPMADLVHRMLQKKPELRPAATEVERELLRMAGGATGTVAVPTVEEPTRATVGRDAQRTHLLRRFARTRAGTGHIVAVTGEPGIGKTSLIEDFVSDLAASGERPIIVRGHCSESLAGAEAYLPILEVLDQLCHATTGETFDEVVRTVAPTWHAQVASRQETSGAPDGAAASQERMKRELGSLLEEVSRIRPLVMVVDDLHWADVSTVDMLNYLSGRFAGMRMLVLTCYRPSDMTLAEHPFLGIRNDLQARGLYEEVALDFLAVEDVARYLELQFPGHLFPGDFPAVIHARTDGSPLFMADLIRYLKDTGGIVEEEGKWRLAGDLPMDAAALPRSVKAMIARKIEQVAEDDRALLLAASVQGHEFDSATLARALERDPMQVEDRLEHLERVHAFLRQEEELEFPDRTLTLRYRFVHVLYQNVLFDSLRPTRRADLSRRVATALAVHAGQDLAPVAARLAVLSEGARDFAAAARYFFLAAQRAVSLFAFREALSLAERGIAGLRSLPETPERHQLELGLQMVRGHAVRSVMGWAAPELERTFARARELCQYLQDPPEVFPVLWNLAFFHMIRGDLPMAREQAAVLMRNAEASGIDAHLMAVHHVAGVTCEFLGEFVDSTRLLERARELHDPARHGEYTAMFGIDPGMVARAMSSRPLWALGYPDRALARSRETIALGRSQRQPVTLVFALIVAQGVHLYRGEAAEAIALGDEIIAMCREYEFPQEAEWARCFQGSALALLGRAAEGVERLQACLASLEALGSDLVRTTFLSLLADAAADAGLPDLGLTAVEEGFVHAERRLEGGFVSELHRTRGRNLLLLGQADAAEASLRAALEHARGQQAASFELRAATALARHLHASGRSREARETLAPVLDRFTEGHGTADLAAAGTLLATLG